MADPPALPRTRNKTGELDRAAPEAGHLSIGMQRTREAALEGYRERLVALRGDGWVKVE